MPRTPYYNRMHTQTHPFHVTTFFFLYFLLLIKTHNSANLQLLVKKLCSVPYHLLGIPSTAASLLLFALLCSSPSAQQQ